MEWKKWKRNKGNRESSVRVEISRERVREDGRGEQRAQAW